MAIPSYWDKNIILVSDVELYECVYILLVYYNNMYSFIFLDQYYIYYHPKSKYYKYSWNLREMVLVTVMTLSSEGPLGALFSTRLNLRDWVIVWESG